MWGTTEPKLIPKLIRFLSASKTKPVCGGTLKRSAVVEVLSTALECAPQRSSLDMNTFRWRLEELKLAQEAKLRSQQHVSSGMKGKQQLPHSATQSTSFPEGWLENSGEKYSIPVYMGQGLSALASAVNALPLVSAHNNNAHTNNRPTKQHTSPFSRTYTPQASITALNTLTRTQVVRYYDEDAEMKSNFDPAKAPGGPSARVRDRSKDVGGSKHFWDAMQGRTVDSEEDIAISGREEQEQTSAAKRRHVVPNQVLAVNQVTLNDSGSLSAPAALDGFEQVVPYAEVGGRGGDRGGGGIGIREEGRF